MKRSDVLRFLAESLSVRRTLERFPGLDPARLRAWLAEEADRVSGDGPTADPGRANPGPRGRRLILQTDGASRGNPGPAGAGAVLMDESGQVVATAKRFLGEMTNNQAEYEALLLGLDLALEADPSWLGIRLDSQLLVKQLNGQYRVKNPELTILHGRVKDKLNDLSAYDILHIRRELNAEADRLANQALDEAGG